MHLTLSRVIDKKHSGGFVSPLGVNLEELYFEIQGKSKLLVLFASQAKQGCAEDLF